MYIKMISICLVCILFLTPLRANENRMKPLSVRLENGLKISALHNSELPIIVIEIVVKKGYQNQPNTPPELAIFTAHLLIRGCRNRSNSQINKTLTSLGTKIDVTVNDEAIVYSCLVLRWDFEVLFALLTDVIRYPTFEAHEFFCLQQQLLNKIQENSNHYLMNWVGHNHGLQNWLPILQSITREDVQNYYQHHFRPDQIEIRLLGNLLVPGIIGKMKKKLKLWTNPSVNREKKKKNSLPPFQFAATENLLNLKIVSGMSSGEN